MFDPRIKGHTKHIIPRESVMWCVGGKDVETFVKKWLAFKFGEDPPIFNFITESRVSKQYDFGGGLADTQRNRAKHNF